MRIAVAQMSTRAGDFSDMLPRMGAYARRAADEGADLLVFGAMTLCGASLVPRQDREGFLLDLAAALLEFSHDLPCACLLPVLSDVDGAPMSEALLVTPEEVRPVRLASYLRQAATDTDPASSTLAELEYAGARLGIAFSYEDLDDFVDFDYDVDVIVFLSPYGFAADDPSSALGTAVSEGRYLADAQKSGAWIVGVGSLGCYDAQVFCGSSFVLAPWGELAAQSPSFEEDLLVCDIDPAFEGPLAHPLVPEVYDAPLTTWGALVMGLSERVNQAGRGDVCAVVDGSLGSMLVLALATDALGPTHVHAVVMQTGEREADASAAELVRNLRLAEKNVVRVDVRGADDAASARDLAEMRLAALARATGAVALGSADKTGLALEDDVALTAARLMPLSDLYRSDTVTLAHLRNTISPVIPSSAGVRFDIPGARLLEQEMPSAEVRLEFVDLVLSSYLEWEQSLSDIAAERGHAEAVADVVGALRDGERLRRATCSGIVITSKTLAEGRAPAGVAWRDRVRADNERMGEETMAAIARARQEVAAATAGEGAAAREDEADDEAPVEAPAEREVPLSGEPLRERDVRDLLGYLRDFSQGGGFFGDPSAGAQGGAPTDPGAPGLWNGPFSEN